MVHRILIVAMLSLPGAPLLAAPYAYFAGTDLAQTDNRVLVVDVETRTQVASIPTSARVANAAAATGERYIYAAMPSAGRIAVIDSIAQAVTTEIAFPNPGAIAVIPGKARAYVASGAGGIPTIIRSDTQILGGPIAGAAPATLIEVNATGTRAYLANSSTTLLQVVDTSLDAVVGSLSLPVPPGSVAVHPNGKLLYVGTGAATGITVVDLDTLTIKPPFPTTAPTLALATNASGTLLYVGQSSAVAAIDTAFGTASPGFALSGIPRAIQVAPVTGTIHVVADSGLPSTPAPGALFAANPANGAILATFSTLAISSAPRFIGGVVPLVFDTPGILTGLWWNPAQSGWGVHLTQRRETVFASWFTYDDKGAPKWYFASGCHMTAPLVCATCIASTSCDGSLFEATGPKFFGAAFDPNGVKPSPAGVFHIDFADKDNAAMSYTVGARHDTVAITRAAFLPAPPANLVDFTDLWSSPAEPGWGIAMTQTAGSIFLAWFVYDDAGRPVWYVASGCATNSINNGCSGTLYKTVGPPGPIVTGTFDSTKVSLTPVGTVNVAFQTKDTAFLTYTVNGVPGFKGIQRQLF